MFKIATVLILVAVIAIHAAPQGRRDSDFRRTDVGAFEPERDEWQYEDVPNENQLENGQRGIRKAFWQYEIAHIQPNKKGSRAGNGSIREEQNSQEETQSEEQNENEEEQEAEEPQSEEQGQENEETVEEQDQLDVRQDRVRSEGRRQNSGRGSNERNGSRGRVEQQRSRGRQEGRQGGRQENRQEGRQGRRQEESRESNQQSSEEAEQTNEAEDQIQVEQEGLEEVNQEAPQGDSQENTESKGIADYEYTYGVNDPATGDHKDHWEKRVGDHVEGGYILEQPDGKRRVVKYESGKKGFETNIMQIERKKGHKKAKNAQKQKSVAHSYASVKQNN